MKTSQRARPDLEGLETLLLSFDPCKDNDGKHAPPLPDDDNETDPNTYDQYIVKAFHAKEYYPTEKWEKQLSGPFPCDYTSKLDTTNFLDHKNLSYTDRRLAHCAGM